MTKIIPKYQKIPSSVLRNWTLSDSIKWMFRIPAKLFIVGGVFFVMGFVIAILSYTEGAFQGFVVGVLIMIIPVLAFLFNIKFGGFFQNESDLVGLGGLKKFKYLLKTGLITKGILKTKEYIKDETGGFTYWLEYDYKDKERVDRFRGFYKLVGSSRDIPKWTVIIFNEEKPKIALSSMELPDSVFHQITEALEDHQNNLFS